MHEESAMSDIKEIQRNYQFVPTLLEDTHHGRETSPNEFVMPNDKITGEFPKEFDRVTTPNFPQLSEFEVVRHFTKLSQLNHSIDGGFYPLGSCTMKYNPKINDAVAGLSGFSMLHPYIPERYAQGALQLMYDLQETLKEITGLAACSLHPAAGAHGELVGVKMIHAYHRLKGEKQRNIILVPDSAHGTNPASAALSGFQVRELKSNEKGFIDLEEVASKMDDTVAAIMMTVPNTLGIFEKNIVEIAKLVHDRGGLVYCDGANLNALVGQLDFAKMGVDVMHINLHKTFSTPHGGGGPGAGPVVVSPRLENFLPTPLVRKDKDGRYSLDENIPHSVGKFRAFYGNFGMLVRALCYIFAFGKEKISQISEVAVLNANYLKQQLKPYYYLPYDTETLHEAVFSDKIQNREQHVSTMDIAKRLMDFGFHPPTVYFPLIVRGALMIEPTESESKKELDRFVDAMKHIAKEAQENPEKVKTAPHTAGVKRMDETLAARKPILTWNKEWL
jgi:glycine dehydrogenase subunit 2